ncbi:MAG: protein-L-isoaspartate(D-aspartate) O-methyltransferase [Candidatus Altiarchaeota archaeon]
MSFEGERAALVAALVRGGYLSDGRVIDVLKRVPRELFVPDDVRGHAYVDCPQPIGFNQTISAPHMVAIMSELLDVKPDSRVLEVGTGSGYQAAILGELAGAGSVVSVERIPELAERARTLLAGLNYSNITVVDGDGGVGFQEFAPYDRILVTAAAPEVPQSLVAQLAVHGKMLVPVGGRWSQTLIEVYKDSDGSIRGKSHGGCVFVPLIGRGGWNA